MLEINPNLVIQNIIRNTTKNIVICTLNGICCTMLKVEPMGKPLDIHTEQDNEKEKIIEASH